jgi:hypothetical protein
MPNPSHTNSIFAQQETSSTLPMTELLLTPDDPLLIVLTPFSLKNQWKRDQLGLLHLLPDNTLLWESDHFDGVIEISYSEFRSQASGWVTLLTRPEKGKKVWYEVQKPKWTYTENGIVFDVEICDFSFWKR